MLQEFNRVLWSVAIWLVALLGAGLMLCCVASADDFTGVFREKAPIPPNVQAVETPSIEPAKLMDGICKLRSSKGRSTGINLSVGILTCCHCVQPQESYIAVQCGDEHARAKVIYANADDDVALLAVKWQKPHPVFDVGDRFEEPENVISLGRGAAGLLTVEKHKVLTRYGVMMFATDNPYIHGRSGGAVVNDAGKLVGMAKAVDMTEEPYHGLSVGLGPITSLLDRVPKPFRAIMWSPSWCGVCRSDDFALSEYGHPGVLYECRKGDPKNNDELAFPKEVLDYARSRFPAGTALAGRERGWPVWQIETHTGAWVFAYHARSYEDLIAIHGLEPGQPVPISTLAK